jgi:hypothetical protein
MHGQKSTFLPAAVQRAGFLGMNFHSIWEVVLKHEQEESRN